MTADIRARQVTCNITILDSDGNTISGPHDVSQAIAGQGFQIGLPQFDSQTPNGKRGVSHFATSQSPRLVHE